MTALDRTRQARTGALEARFALRVAAALSERDVGHDVEERLRVARLRACERAGQARVAVSAQVVGVDRGTAALASVPWWGRLASGLPLVVLALGLMLIERLDTQEQILAAAEIDAVLLADELPPRAYIDPGFAEFLKQSAP